MAKKDKRFIHELTEGNGLTSMQKSVIVDTETGVNYLWINEGYAGGLTPLLDADGKPIVTIVDKK